MKIKYEFATETTEIEVSEEWGSILLDLDRLEYNVNHKETRRHCSLQNYDKDENTLPSDFNLEEEILKSERNTQLENAINKLNPNYQYLIREVYFNGRKSCDIAKEKGIHASTIRKSVMRAKNNLKKFL